ncbi:aspartic protease [Pholiota conissans]|uniref:Aspartic protease n=1 Tax=Pholiota conissans TaxID=109636 RepID=A0A9P6CTY7_9AGAR|nr:aspartic protease [Pholiota conissans]
MFCSVFFLNVLLAITTSAKPVVVDMSPVTLPLSRRLNLTSIHNLVRHDQARARSLKSKGRFRSQFGARAVINEPIDNQAVTYIASVGIGSPPTSYNLLVDIGSSNTWVGAGKAYVKTSTSFQTSANIAVTYGSGSFSGMEFTDTVTLASGLVISKQSIGVASSSSGFEGLDGVLGIGPSDLTAGTISTSACTIIPTVFDNLFESGIITQGLMAISFEPATTEDVVNGEITWGKFLYSTGGVDNSKFTGSLSFIPVTTTLPAGEFWGIDQSIRYGASNTILATTSGIYDTGTTLVLLATNAFNKYKTATGAVLDNNTGLLKVTAAQFSNLQSLFFVTTQITLELTANAQLWPRSLNADIGGVSSAIYLIVNDLGTPSGEGLDFVNGYTFLERFYSVYDTTNFRIGVATTPFTKATTN